MRCLIHVEDGATSFPRLQQLLARRGPIETGAWLYVLDLLWLDGRDLRPLPLSERKPLLEHALAFGEPLRFAAHQVATHERQDALLAEACERGWEGLIAKRPNAAYRGGRARAWRKLPCLSRDGVVVAGWTAGKRSGFGALLLARSTPAGLRYVGKVEPEELDELKPEASRLICIHAYVEQSEIDPVFYDRSYYLASDGEVARRPYQRLTRAMAEQLIGSMRADFDPEEFPDRHQAKVLEYLEAKGEGRSVDVDTGRADQGNVVDLMAALEQSLQRAMSGSKGVPPSSEYASMTKSQLYEPARQRDVPGRSSLSKAELLEALQHLDASADVA